MTVCLECSRMKTKELAHPYLKEQLLFPEHYGCNLDALYDCLTAICEPTTIVIRSLPADWQSQNEWHYMRRLWQVMCAAADDNALLRIEIE